MRISATLITKKQRELLGTFQRHGVAFVVIGGFAARLHGAQRATNEIDLCLDWQLDNLDRAAAALRALSARSRFFPSLPVNRTVLRQVPCWRTAVGDVDLLRGILGHGKLIGYFGQELAGYQELHDRSATVQIGGLRLAVASLEDIINSKELAGRPGDRAALPELRSLAASRPQIG